MNMLWIFNNIYFITFILQSILFNLKELSVNLALEYKCKYF